MISLDSRILMINGRYKNASKLVRGDTTIDHDGKASKIKSIERRFLKCAKIQTNNWYTFTHIPLENKILCQDKSWRKITEVNSLYKLQMNEIVEVSKMKSCKDDYQFGVFLGTFLILGGFQDETLVPFLRTSVDVDFPLFGNVNVKNSKFVLGLGDPEFQLFLYEFFNDPQDMIFHNSLKKNLMNGIVDGIFRGMEQNFAHHNLDYPVLEIAYFILNMQKNNEYVFAKIENPEIKECIFFESDHCGFICNNVAMK